MSTCQNDRSIIVISGEYHNCLRTAKELTKKLDCFHLTEAKKADQTLGQEFDAVIFETHNGFSPNAFGAISGTIRCGGYLLILKPYDWPQESLFLQRFEKLLEQHQNIRFINSTEKELSTLNTLRAQSYDTDIASSDQKNAIDAIIHVVKGHRRRPLVITSDRGRGKSASLGIAAAKLFHKGMQNIIVCAPSKRTAAIIFKHAKKLAPDCDLQFFSPDELQQKKPPADLLLIDEAAAIPVPLLTTFLKQYSRVVFATTQHGYEGSGRGFAINFRKILDQLTPNWNHCQLKTPIRWKENDPLEQFVFDALLLNSEQAEEKSLDAFNSDDIIFTNHNKQDLVEEPDKLEEIAGLLVNAHYQTKPSDFMQMLDDTAMRIVSLSFNHHIIAVALIVDEGGIEPEIAQAIFEGKRRLKGHLVAQALAANIGIEAAPCLQAQRLIRIAVHPSLQKQGLGTTLLKTIAKQSNADYLSTSFGATEPLVQFWKRCEYTPVYLSMKRDASSGTHSVIMLHAITNNGETLLEEASQYFQNSFPHLLSDPFKNLELEISLALLTAQQTTTLTTQENSILSAFANAQRGYENSLYPIWNKTCQKLAKTQNLNRQEKHIILLKVLQKKSWKDVINSLDKSIGGKKEALQLLRQAIKKLLK